MKIYEAALRIEKRIPLSWAEEWDNPGLVVGDPLADVSSIAVALDATPKTVAMAADRGCGLLVTHHPIIFNPLKTLLFSEPAQRTVAAAVQKGVALYAAHTNWDAAPEGVNVCLANALDLAEVEPLCRPAVKNGSWGLGAVGKFVAPVLMKELMELLRERWHITYCLGYGDGLRRIKKAAVGGGACGDMWRDALKAGADVFITSDMAYHNRNDALSMGLNLIVTDHGETERVSLIAMEALVEDVTGLPAVILDEPAVKMID